MTNMIIGYVQFTPELGNFENNLKRLRSFVKTQIDSQVDLLVFPELVLTGYALKTKDELSPFITHEIIEKTTNLAVELAEHINGYVVMGYPEKEEEGFYNSAMLVGKDGLEGNYRKSHLFGFEKELYLPGNLGFPVFKTPKADIGLMICFDWIFPESARTLALNGAQIIAHCTNLVMPYCQRAMFARAVENHVFTISSNRCGSENWNGELTFTGESIIYDPAGNILKKAPIKGDVIDFIEIDVETAKNKNINSKNNLFEDRAVDFYKL
jgi:predicted amidohydrolase